MFYRVYILYSGLPTLYTSGLPALGNPGCMGWFVLVVCTLLCTLLLSALYSLLYTPPLSTILYSAPLSTTLHYNPSVSTIPLYKPSTTLSQPHIHHTTSHQLHHLHHLHHLQQPVQTPHQLRTSPHQATYLHPPSPASTITHHDEAATLTNPLQPFPSSHHHPSPRPHSTHPPPRT